MVAESVFRGHSATTVDHWRSCGCLAAKDATLRGVEYRFVPPVENTVEVDRAAKQRRFEQAVLQAKVDAKASAAAPKPLTAQARRLKESASTCRTLDSFFKRPRDSPSQSGTLQ